MAAFENVSRLTLQRHNRDSLVDMRVIELPPRAPSFDGFDPRLHRDPKRPIKPWMAYLNLLRSAFGPGVLGMPQAVSLAGFITGPIMTIATGFLVLHSHVTLLWSLNEISRQLKIPYTSFRYGFRIALLHGPRCFESIGRNGPIIISFFMFLSQLGICCVFVIFTTDSLRDLMDWPNSYKAMYWMFIPYVLLEFFMRDLWIISQVSMLGNILNFIGLVIIIYLIFDDPHPYEIKLFSTSLLSLTFAFGMNMFSLSACAVILSLEKALLSPINLTKKWGILDIGILVPTFVSAIFGPLGYWSFGAMEDNILRSLPYDKTLSMVAICLYMIAIALAYPILCHPAVEILLEVYRSLNPFGKEDISDFQLKMAAAFFRVSFVALSFFICYYLPYQGPFVAFVGNLCTSLLILVFPAMMEISILYPGPYGKYNYYLLKDITLIVMGSLTSIIGIAQCGYLLYLRMLFSI